MDAALDGLEVFGGLGCSDWAYTGQQAVAVSPEPSAWVVEGLVEGLRLEDFELEAADATSPGGSSIAMLVRASQNILLRRVRLVAGNGAAGAAGQDGQDGASGEAAGAKKDAGDDAGDKPVDATVLPKPSAAEQASSTDTKETSADKPESPPTDDKGASTGDRDSKSEGGQTDA